MIRKERVIVKCKSHKNGVDCNNVTHKDDGICEFCAKRNAENRTKDFIGFDDVLKKIPQFPVREDCQLDQLTDLLKVTRRLGMTGNVVDVLKKLKSDNIRDSKLVLPPFDPYSFCNACKKRLTRQERALKLYAINEKGDTVAVCSRKCLENIY